MLERSDKLYKINNMSKGIMVYADDTNVIARIVEDLNK
jgi:hypothetical protein